ncbi:TetR family transcriptional regulator [Cupriavidus basilensis]|uniref:TetR family transcriptional regulator n=1 Tax=Cupriavidus basilensis TaxID=68895 RepID=UPI0023E880EC|nr:TetR family transcriptional regulator [Cupriavidus basilensis]MDF3883911.1 TetR family transcriptional regulator [Cupriavidus basilensis]
MGSASTRHEIEAAITRILQGMPMRVDRARQLSIAAVAEEAGVSNATIHNRHPDMAEQIRRILKEGREAVMAEKNTEISNLQRKLAEVRKALRKRDDEVRRLKTLNLLLAKEIQALREELEEPCVPPREKQSHPHIDDARKQG